MSKIAKASKYGFQPGHPKMGGRKKGTVNKKATEVQQIMALYDFSPAEALLYCYENAQRIFEIRAKRGNLVGAVDALKLASSTAESIAQYVYPKKRAIEHSGEIGLKTWADFIAAAEDENVIDVEPFEPIAIESKKK